MPPQGHKVSIQRVGSRGESETHACSTLAAFSPADADREIVHHLWIERVELVGDRAIELAVERSRAPDSGRSRVSDRVDETPAIKDESVSCARPCTQHSELRELPEIFFVVVAVRILIDRLSFPFLVPSRVRILNRSIW